MPECWILSRDLFQNLLKKLEEHKIKAKAYLGKLDDGRISICVEVNGKHYCRG